MSNERIDDKKVDRGEHISSRYPFIVVVGPVGIGKTTFCELLENGVNTTRLIEPYKDNPYLENFYKVDPSQYSFDCQMSFLADKGLQTLSIPATLTKGPVVQDPGIDVDFMIATAQMKMGWMDPEEYSAYTATFKNVFKNALEPDVYIALTASKDTVVKRIKERGREMELLMLNRYPEYFPTLVDEFNAWLKEKQKGDSKIVVLDTEKFDYSKGDDEKEELTREATNWLNYYLSSENQRNSIGSDGSKLIIPGSFVIPARVDDRFVGNGRIG